MKLLTKEEIDAHRYYTMSGGLKGALAGLAISGLLFKVVPMRYPRFNPLKLTYSLRAALFISPPTFLATICAEEASNGFDREMYSAAETKETIEALKRWQQLPWTEKLLEATVLHKYKIILGAWAASMYGSWRFIDRDPIMTKAQKAVQARMFAQGFTVLMLLASIGLSMCGPKVDAEAEKKAKSRRWEALLDKAEEEQARAAVGSRTNEERVKGKIFRYD